MKIIGLISVAMFGAVYWGIGAFLNSIMALWLLLFPANLQSATSFVQPSNIQLVGSVQQATPSKLQSAINVQ